MKSHTDMQSSVSGHSARSSIHGAMPSMSERQMQAYLMARDAIRRVRHTSAFFDSMEKDVIREHRATDRHRDCH